MERERARLVGGGNRSFLLGIGSPCFMSTRAPCQLSVRTSLKIGTIQRRLAWSLRKDDTIDSEWSMPSGNFFIRVSVGGGTARSNFCFLPAFSHLYRPSLIYIFLINLLID